MPSSPPKLGMPADMGGGVGGHVCSRDNEEEVVNSNLMESQVFLTGQKRLQRFYEPVYDPSEEECWRGSPPPTTPQFTPVPPPVLPLAE